MHQIVDVVAVRYRFVAAAKAMDMIGIMIFVAVIGGATVWIRVAHLKYVLDRLVTVGMMKMAVMQVVHVITVPDGDVTATGAMMMRVFALTEVLVTVVGHRCLL